MFGGLSHCNTQCDYSLQGRVGDCFFSFRLFCSFFDVEGKCWRGRGFEFWEFQKKKNFVVFILVGEDLETIEIGF